MNGKTVFEAFAMLFVIGGFMLWAILQSPKIIEQQEAEQAAICRECVLADTLTEWQVLQMASALTESRFNPDAKGATQDLGILQITPIYAREASRLNKDRDYTHSEALDTSTALEMFNVVQSHHNPTQDIDKAIRLHNPGGDSIGYSNKVKANMEFIRRMEATRRAVKQGGQGYDAD